jgi:hypothetical protein
VVVVGVDEVTGAGAGAAGVLLPPLAELELPAPALTVAVPVLAPVDAVVLVVGRTAAVVAVVATCCGVNGLRPLPVSFEFPGVVCTEIAGSAVPEE